VIVAAPLRVATTSGPCSVGGAAYLALALAGPTCWLDSRPSSPQEQILPQAAPRRFDEPQTNTRKTPRPGRECLGVGLG